MRDFWQAITISSPFYILYLVFGNIYWIPVATIVFGGSFVYLNILRTDYKKINPIGLFALSSSIIAIANLVALFSIGTIVEKIYFLYAEKSFLENAFQINFFGVVFILFGYLIVGTIYSFPKLRYRISTEQPMNLFVMFNVVLLFLIVTNNLPPFFGAIKSFMVNIPLFSAFFFARYSSIRNDNRYFIFGLIIVILLTVNAVYFAYLRSEMIKPSIFFLLGIVVGHRSIKPLLKLSYIPFYVFFALFFTYFGIFGSERKLLGTGLQRVERIIEIKEETPQLERSTPISRATNLNQLTQVVKLAERDGFYNGSTFEYLSIAFIPRFLWPDKPLIQTGAWFAEKIGYGWKDETGRYHNSINMTVPGEFYLNFGMMGVILGCMLFGAFFRLLWNSVNFNDTRDIISNMFGAYLLFLGFFSIGIDLQIVVTVIAIYLLFLFVDRIVLNRA